MRIDKINIKKGIIGVIIMGVLSCVSEKKKEETQIETVPGPTYGEIHRPQYHYTTRKNWINDPNGLIKHKGRYHMYYQCNPQGSQWGHMSWGHATSKDLVHWQEQPVAIPEGKYMIFSGTTAADTENRSGFFNSKDGIVAAYTSFEFKYTENGDIDALAQHQSIAFSEDGGFTYTDLPENPVLDIRSKDFRDPKLFFDERTQKWNMLVSLADQHKIAFYQSDNLKDWEEVSQFGPLGDTSAVWECPDLFELKVKGTDTTKWVLSLSAGHPQEGFLGMQYFIGEFDGTSFVADSLQYPMYLDYGKDFYAGITFANTGHREYATMIGWLGCHIYSKDTPTTIWRGAMSLPRNLFLERTESGIRLKSQPPTSYLKTLFDEEWTQVPMALHNGTIEVPIKSKAYWATLTLKNKGGRRAGLKVLKSNDHETLVGVDFSESKVFIDRRNSGTATVNEKFKSKDSAPWHPSSEEITLDIYVDHSVIEVFIENGEQVLTSLIYPEETGDGIVLFSEQGEVSIENIAVKNLKSIWE